MILKTCLIVGALLLADVPWWDDSSPKDATKVPDTVRMLLGGGVSADGKLQMFQVDLNGGFCVLKGASEIDRALWNDDDSLVAIADHDTRHSMALHLVSIENGKGQKITIPPFGKAIAEKMANIHGGAANACGCRPLKWDGRELTFQFYAGDYSSIVKMKVPTSHPQKAILVSESAPEEIGGPE
jgi:hypothetical protein